MRCLRSAPTTRRPTAISRARHHRAMMASSPPAPSSRRIPVDVRSKVSGIDREALPMSTPAIASAPRTEVVAERDRPRDTLEAAVQPAAPARGRGRPRPRSPRAGTQDDALRSAASGSRDEIDRVRERARRQAGARYERACATLGAPGAGASAAWATITAPLDTASSLPARLLNPGAASSSLPWRPGRRSGHSPR